MFCSPEPVVGTGVREVNHQFEGLSTHGFEGEDHVVYQLVSIGLANSDKVLQNMFYKISLK